MSGRLVYLHNSAIPTGAANTVHVMRMCAAFAELGWDVTLVIPETPQTRDVTPAQTRDLYGGGAAFDIVRIAPGPLKTVGYAVAAARLARRLEPTIVYGRCARSCAVAASFGLPVIFEAHGPLSSFARLGRVAVRYLARARTLKAFVVISQALSDYYRGALPHLEGKLFVAHDGADPAEPPPAANVAHAQQGDRLRVVYAGSLFPGKGMELIAAIAPLVPQLDFVVAGGEGALLAQWRSTLADVDNVELLGHVPHRDVSSLIHSGDIVIAPYQRSVLTVDGKFDAARWMSPLKIFEYMAHGKPMICSDLPVIREVLQDGANAILCNPDNIEYWVGALKRLADDNVLRSNIGYDALVTFQKKYSWTSRARSLVGLL